jgi:thymidylate synthase (FAD)
MSEAKDTITLTSKITIKPIQHVGGDHLVIAAARTSTQGEDALKYAEPGMAEESAGLINYLLKSRHGAPFEHASMTFSVHAPAFVWWEWTRHRIAFSYSIESSRYRQLEPVFWTPRPDRPMVPDRGHKPARPKFALANVQLWEKSIGAMEYAYQAAWHAYAAMIDNGIANEVARSVLPFAVYFSGWVTTNPRALMAFLSLRTHEPEARFPSYPQAEIEEAARACEEFFAEHWPLTYKAFCANGRVGP